MLPLPVTFTLDYSDDNATMWNWSFGDSGEWYNTTTKTNPTHIYSSGGIYTVKEVSQNQYEGYSITSKTNYIIVGSPVTSTWISNYSAHCVPLTVQFTDLSLSLIHI